MLAHRLLGGGSSSLSVSCPSLGSALIAAARAHLWSSFRWRSESPLLAHQETKRQEKVSCLFGRSRPFPGLPPGWLWCTSPLQAVFMPPTPVLSLRSDHSPSLSSQPRLPQRLSRQASRAGECCSAPSLCAGISPLCPPHPCGCALLRGSEASPLRHPQSLSTKGLLVCGNLSSFTAPSPRCRSCAYSFVSVFPFFFCPTQVRGEFLVFWEV